MRNTMSYSRLGLLITRPLLDMPSRISQVYRFSTIAPRPMRACIVGSGPAGFYTAYKLLSEVPDCTIDLFEALPVPFGLARFGVAPDHPEVKNVTHKFDEVARSPRVRYFGNLRIGQDLPVKDLARAYDSIVFAHGASLNKSLGIKGEDLNGVMSARSFVGWYNGLPEAANLQLDLQNTETAVVIGQGNVALDIARILLSDVDELRKTDIADHALEALAKSKITRVNIVGRRGPLQASFTIKEVRELINLTGASFVNSSQLNYRDILQSNTLQRPQKRLIELLAKQDADSTTGTRHWDIQYRLSPKEFLGNSRLEAIAYEKNDLVNVGGQVKTQKTGETVTHDAQLAFLSIGYQSEAINGMEDVGVIFDTNKHIVPNESGRVTTMDGFVAGMYCSGWAKVGPVGVIASTMRDAFETADMIARDWADSSLTRKTLELEPDDLIAKVQQTKTIVTWDKWKKIQSYEEQKGALSNPARPARKVIDIDEMLHLAI